MASVQLDRLTKHFGAMTAVDELSLTVKDGEFLVLAGPSGCGKTTILRMIAGLERPSQGQILIGEQVANDLPPRQRHVGMVFQDHALYPHLDVQANMEFGLVGHQLSRSQVHAKAVAAARLVQLEGLLQRYPNELSGGELQRVALGKTLAGDPHVWLLDEPFSHLDTNLRYTLRNELARLQREVGVTTILVTHDLTEAMSLADRIAVVDDGKLLQVGTPSEIYHRPSNRRVAESWGLPPINMLTATVVDTNPDGVELVVEQCPQHLTIQGNFELPKGGQISLGVRPEDVRIHKTGAAHAEGALPASIERAEETGADALLHLHCGGFALIARVSSREVPDLSDKLLVDFDSQHIHFFDSQTDVRLTGPLQAP